MIPLAILYILGPVILVAGILSCTVYHNTRFIAQIKTSGGNRLLTQSLGWTMEFLFGIPRFIAWATKGHRVSEELLIGIYGPDGARSFQAAHPRYKVRRSATT